MKKYITGIIAIVIAVGAFAFTNVSTVKRPLTNVRFQFDGTPGGESSPANWDYAPSASCGQHSNKACVIEVSSDVVTDNAIDPDKLEDKYGTATLPMTTDANGTRPTPGQPEYLLIDNKN
jgi:hypothetical protein